MNVFKENAEAICRELGLSLFPIQPKNKIPATTNGFKEATRDLKRIKEWMKYQPTANIGVPTGKINGFWVLDVDGRNNGFESLKELLAEGNEIVPTTIVHTPGKGVHYYWQFDKRISVSRNGILPGVDIKSNGGYIVFPPSIHPNGGIYRWAESSDLITLPIAKAPEWLITVLLKKTGSKSKTKNWRSFIRNPHTMGTRNNDFTSLCGLLLGNKKIDPIVSTELLLSWNLTHNRPPLTEREALKTIKSILKRELIRRNS